MDRLMERYPGDDVKNNGLGDVVEFAAIIYVHLIARGGVKTTDASVGIAEAYLDRFTSTGLEGQ